MAMAMRRMGIVATCAALALGASACGGDDDDEAESTAASEESAKVALLLPESKTTRYEQQDRPNFERRVKELCAGCEVLYANAEQDPAKQLQQAEQVITQGAKVIVISAVDVKAAAGIAQRAKQANVGVISYGRLVADADLDYYVSIDPFKVGQQQGTVMLAALKKDGKTSPNVVMIHGSPSDSNAAPYKAGAHDVLDKAGVKVVREFDTPDWSPDAAQREMEQAITSVGKDGFDAVYVANDGMAGGAIAALKGSDIDPATRFVTGQDAELAGVQRILAGEQLMTVYQPITQIAETAAELAVPLALDKPVSDVAQAKVDNGFEQVPSVLLDTIAITEDNVKVLIDEGFLTTEQICTEDYADACAKAGLQ
jgi:D-xylose transport system substrate-binding protein